MAIPVAVNDILAVTVANVCNNQTAMNTLHFRVTLVAGVPTLEQFAAALDAALSPLYCGIQSAGSDYYGLAVSRVLPLPRSIQVVSAANGNNGDYIGETLPTQVAGMMSFFTNLAGQAQRGRIYLPFPPEDANDATAFLPDAAYITAAGLLGNYLTTPLSYTTGANTVGAKLVLYNRALGTTKDVAGFVVRSKWATQKKRGSYGQTNTYPPF